MQLDSSAENTQDATSDSNPSVAQVWRLGIRGYSLMLVGLVVLSLACRQALHGLWVTWNDVPEYSHGLALPVLAVFLIWQQREVFERATFKGSVTGLILIILAGVALLLGTMGGAYTLQQYAFALGFTGLVLAWTGIDSFRQMAMPVALLFLMVPQPEFILNNLSTRLQLVSSELGVAVIRFSGISVYLEGNVIDLGSYRLQVVDACAGLRYLFPLMTIGLLVAHFFKAPFWKRALVFLASIPITVTLNSLRIAMIGWMVDRWGSSMAEGFIHEFQGWAVFMVSGALLLGVAALLNRVGPSNGSWVDVFGVDLPAATPASVVRLTRPIPPTFLVALVLVGMVALSKEIIPNRPQIVPPPPELTKFPLNVGRWKGGRDWLAPNVLNNLELDDYFYGVYTDGQGAPLTLYIPYYSTQRDRRVIHSPASCLPGNGWRIVESKAVIISGTKISANRMLISNGEERALVYYWFDQRGRNLTSEWLVKWYLFQDSVVLRRSDGAMVRVMTSLRNGDSLETADARLQSFVAMANPMLDQYLH